MDYRPRYTQPFTLAEAVRLGVPIITEEIARLQNSLLHLTQTQDDLKEAIADSPDPVLSQAFDENEVVIGSQKERINMLKMALSEKGIPVGDHYDGPSNKQETPESPPTARGDTFTTTQAESDEGGIDL